MECSQAVLTLFLLVPCEQGGGDSLDLAVAEALAAPQRMEADRQADPLRRPDRVLEFLELRPGMQVLDLFSGGGYYSEILSRVVGEEGHVVAHNNQAYLAFVGAAVEERYRDDRLTNVEQLIVEADALAFPEASFDAALAMLTWHDFYFSDEENGWPAVNRERLLETLCRALKPGAVLGISDHVASSGSDPAVSGEKLHRIDPARLRADIEGGCFEYEAELSVLRNPNDDLQTSVFDEGTRGRSDRVVYRFRRKAS